MIPDIGEKKRLRRMFSALSLSMVNILSSIALTFYRGAKVEQRVNALWSFDPRHRSQSVDLRLPDSDFTERIDR